MIGTLPMAALAPLDYRYALDAALTLLPSPAPPLVRCNVAALAGEIRQRLPDQPAAAPAAALWIEPLAATWQAELAALASALPRDGTLVVVASRPLARLLPECRGWAVPALGRQPLGLIRLQRALGSHGLRLDRGYGIHSAAAIGLSRLGQLLGRLDRADLADRLEFAARLRYCVAGPGAALATVALLLARKEHAGC